MKPPGVNGRRDAIVRRVGFRQRLSGLRNLRLPGWHGPGRVASQWVITQRSGQNRSDPATQSYRDFSNEEVSQLPANPQRERA
jgi:hypothetical protein